jgi:nucleotide-binding universal stress UspA family protein
MEGAQMQKPVVCGVDGSAQSQAALTVAARLADSVDARLVVAHVVEQLHTPYAALGATGPGLPAPPPATVLEAQVRDGERLVKDMTEQAGLGTAERRVVSGVPAHELAKLAEDENAAFIVVGSRGRSALKAAVLGSVSTTLIGVAHRPVLVIPAVSG